MIRNNLEKCNLREEIVLNRTDQRDKTHVVIRLDKGSNDDDDDDESFENEFYQMILINESFPILFFLSWLRNTNFSNNLLKVFH